MAKTNVGLVEYAKAQLGRPYWFGTFGQIANAKLWAEKAKQYPKYYSDKRKAVMKDRGDEGKKVHDCFGIPKGYLMSTGVDMPATYNPQYDISADRAFDMATEKGTIDTLPEIPGIGLWKKGHYGTYIGGGKEIEARGFDYGVLEDEVSNTKFTHWFKVPFIEYVEEPENVTIDDLVNDEGTYIVKAGDTLSKLAGEWGCSVDDIASLNHIIDKDLIIIGDKLLIPDAKSDISESPVIPQIWVGIVATKHDPLRVRKGAGFNYSTVKLLPKGAEVNFVGENENGWYKLADGSGYVFADLITRKNG